MKQKVAGPEQISSKVLKKISKDKDCDQVWDIAFIQI